MQGRLAALALIIHIGAEMNQRLGGFDLIMRGGPMKGGFAAGIPRVGIRPGHEER